MPAGNLLGDDPDIVGKVRGVGQGNVVQQDSPGQHNPSALLCYFVSTSYYYSINSNFTSLPFDVI